MQLDLTLGVTDLQRTEEFYCEIIQLSPQRSQPEGKISNFLLLRFGPASIVFRPLKELEAQHPALLQNLSRQSLGVGMQLELSCPDFTAVRRNIERYQWPISYELEDDEHRRSEIWLHDPDGYLLVLNEES